MKSDRYKGTIPTFYACYDKAGEVSEDEVRALTRYFVDQGVKGVYVSGSLGECIYQFVEDRGKTLEAVMDKATGYLAIIVHVACNDTRDNRILAAHAQDLGVGGITAIPLICFKLPEYSIAGCRSDTSEATPETDFTIYNIPQLAGTALTMSLLKTMFLNNRVAGVKNSSMSIQDIQMFKAEAMKTRQDFVMSNGPDEQLVSGLAIEADGGIGGTYGAVPELSLKIHGLMSENRIAEARIIQYKADEIVYRLCLGTCNIHAMIKGVLRISRRTDMGGVRKPLTDLYGSDRAITGEAATMIENTKERHCWHDT